MKPLGDCNAEQEPEPAADTAGTVVLSLCGGLADGRDVSAGMLSSGPALPRTVTEPRAREKGGKTLKGGQRRRV